VKFSPRERQPRATEQSISWREELARDVEPGVRALLLRTGDGDIEVRHHLVERATAGVIWVGGAGGGLDGPARGLYPEACRRLQQRGVAGLRLHYRFPNHLDECVIDTAIGAQFLAGNEITNIGLVGHSFGGAVVIAAGAMLDMVKAVVPMSTQTYGTERAAQVAPRAMLLIHGTRDEILPDDCSRDVLRRAREPKELRLFEGARHGLDEAREEILELLVNWLTTRLGTNSHRETRHAKRDG
jgi:alpha/beta superfamily hydrolase